jgi:hypothetical protein
LDIVETRFMLQRTNRRGEIVCNAAWSSRDKKIHSGGVPAPARNAYRNPMLSKFLTS